MEGDGVTLAEGDASILPRESPIDKSNQEDGAVPAPACKLSAIATPRGVEGRGQPGRILLLLLLVLLLPVLLLQVLLLLLPPLLLLLRWRAPRSTFLSQIRSLHQKRGFLSQTRSLHQKGGVGVVRAGAAVSAAASSKGRSALAPT